VTQLHVGNYLAVSGEPDYDVTLVEAIVEHLSAHPITQGYDQDSYWQTLRASRPRLDAAAR
jgi:hypothetical protein